MAVKRRGQVDVAVCGGGVVGASCALALAQAGLQVALIDTREPSPWDANAEHDLRVFALSPASLRLLDHIGVWRSVLDMRASPYARMEVWTRGGRIGFDAHSEGQAELGFIVENAVLVQSLWQALRAHPSVRVVAPATVHALDVDPERATLELVDGSVVHASLVVGADSAQSQLRELAGIGVQRAPYGHSALVAHVRHAGPHEGVARQRFHDDWVLAFLPLSDGRSSIVWSQPDTEAQRREALPDEAFLDELQTAIENRLGPLQGISARARFPLVAGNAQRYVGERVALAGDAAHTVHPLAGQGLNLGLQDVAALVEILAEAQAREGDLGAFALLRRYERWRRSETALASLGFDSLQKLFAAPGPILGMLRGFGLDLVDRIPPLKRGLLAHASGWGGRIASLQRQG